MRALAASALAASALAAAGGAGSQVAQYVPLRVPLPSGGGAVQEVRVAVPATPLSSGAAPSAGKLLKQVRGAWAAVVDANPVGLMDAKLEARQGGAAALTKEEAWHHFSAAQEGVLDSARFLVTFGAVASLQSGGTELHIAAALGQEERLQELLDDPERGLDVDERHPVDGTTPLLAAIAAGQTRTVALLLRLGAQVEATGHNQATPLHLAAALGRVEVVQALLDAGAAVDAAHPFHGNRALHFAAEMGAVEVIQVLCANGADGNARTQSQGTPLHTAADSNQTAAARALVGHCGSDVHALLASDTTPLYLAAQRGLDGLCEVLVGELGADPNFEMPRGANIGAELELAASSRTSDGLESEAGRKRRQGGFYAARNTEVGNGATALHVAAENGHLGAAAVLLRHGALSSASMEGATPLIIAMQYGHPRIARLLLEHGGHDPLVRARVPRDGSFALLVATDLTGPSTAAAPFAALLKRLLAHPDIDLDQDNGRGVTALSHAIGKGDVRTATWLLEAGASVLASRPDALHVLAQVGSPSPALLTALVNRAREEASNALGHSHRAWAAWRNSEASDVGWLHAAAAQGHCELLAPLAAALPGGAGDPNARAKSTGATPLMMAAKAGHSACVASLLELGADVALKADAQPLFGATALYLAAQEGHVAAARLLLAAGADTEASLLEYGTTPLLAAAERGLRAMVELLLESGAAIEARSAAGVTPLLSAASGGSAAVVRLLAGAGANLRASARARATGEDMEALQWALHHAARPAVVRVLLSLLPLPAEHFGPAVVELLRVQALPSRARAPAEAAELLEALLARPEWASQPLPAAALFVAVHAHHGDEAAASALLVLFRSAQWRRSQQADLALLADETTGGTPPLLAAAESGKARVAELLLAHLPSLASRMVVQPGPSGESAIDVARRKRDPAMLRVLGPHASGTNSREEL